MTVATNSQHERAVAEHSRTAGVFAERYGTLAGNPYANAFTYSRLRLAHMIARHLPEPAAGTRLLDVGCGTGHQLRDLRGAGFDVSGVDGSREMLEYARQLNPGADLHEADVGKLPFADGSFDVVICLEVLRYLPDPMPCLTEIRRVLRPGGVGLVTATPVLNLNGYALINPLALRLPQHSLTRLRQYFTTSRRLRAQLPAAGFAQADVHGVYLGPINWLERLAPGRMPGFLRRWERIDDKLADRVILRDVANMYLVRAVAPV